MISLVAPSSMKSATSYLGGLSADHLMSLMVLAMPCSLLAKVSTYLLPGSSQSGHRTTSAPRRGSRNAGVSQLVFPAPPPDVVAVKPSDIRASAHFSPSVMWMVSSLLLASRSWGSL